MILNKKILLFIFLHLNFAISSSWACDCDTIFSYSNSVEVFIGYVEKIELKEQDNLKKITLNLKVSYKGKFKKKRPKTIVYSIPNIYGYNHWEVGETFLVFVEKIENNQRIVNQCSITAPIHYETDYNGNYVGHPSLNEVKRWGFENEIWKKWHTIY